MSFYLQTAMFPSSMALMAVGIPGSNPGLAEQLCFTVVYKEELPRVYIIQSFREIFTTSTRVENAQLKTASLSGRHRVARKSGGTHSRSSPLEFLIQPSFDKCQFTSIIARSMSCVVSLLFENRLLTGIFRRHFFGVPDTPGLVP